METLSGILMIAAIAVFVYILIKILSAPIRLLFKILINAALGYIVLFIVNFLGGFVGLSIAMNFLNALIVGFLGVPGVVILIVLELFL